MKHYAKVKYCFVIVLLCDYAFRFHIVMIMIGNITDYKLIKVSVEIVTLFCF